MQIQGSSSKPYKTIYAYILYLVFGIVLSIFNLIHGILLRKTLTNPKTKYNKKLIKGLSITLITLSCMYIVATSVFLVLFISLTTSLQEYITSVDIAGLFSLILCNVYFIINSSFYLHSSFNNKYIKQYLRWNFPFSVLIIFYNIFFFILGLKHLQLLKCSPQPTFKLPSLTWKTPTTPII